MNTRWNISRRIISAIFCLLILSLCGVSQGAEEISRSAPSDIYPVVKLMPEVKVSIDRTPGCHRYRPQVAFDYEHHQYMVVWHNTWDNGDRNVYARRLDVSGTPIGNPFALSGLPPALGDQVHPNVVYNAVYNEFLVVWMLDVSFNNTRYEIWGARLPWNSSSAGTAFRIGELTAGDGRTLWYPSVAWNSYDNEYLVIWDTFQEGNPPGIPLDIGYRRVSASGSSMTGGIITLHGQPTESDLVYNLAMNQYMVVWARLVAHELEPAGIYAARLNYDASIAAGDFAIHTNYSDNRNPAVATNEQNRYMVMFQYSQASYSYMYVRTYDVSGNFLAGGGFGDSLCDPIKPDLAASGGVEWVGGYELYCSSLPGAHIEGGQFEETTYGFGMFSVSQSGWNKHNVAIAGGDHGFLLVYENRSTQSGSRQHIYATKIWEYGLHFPLIIK